MAVWRLVTIGMDGSSLLLSKVVKGCEKLKSFLMKSTYSYFSGPLLPCLHPASKDSAVHGLGHLANFPYDLPEDVTPLTECGRSRFLFHEFSWYLPAFARDGVRGGRLIKSYPI